jgi:hypothetical protein
LATIKKCLYKGNEIDVTTALKYREQGVIDKGDFTCVECGEALRAHKEGGHSSAHFEHFKRNAACSLSTSPNPKGARQQVYEYFAPDTTEALEGYELDHKVLSKSRNREIAHACNVRDNHTCQACNFKFSLSGKYVIDAHHTIPFSSGERVVKLEELVSLCPNCHRIAHLRRPPYSVKEIVKILDNKP